MKITMALLCAVLIINIFWELPRHLIDFAAIALFMVILLDWRGKSRKSDETIS